MLGFVPASARTVLDVGSHLGGFGKALRDEDPGRVLWAVETDADAAQTAAAYYDRVIVGGYPEALADCEQSFDCIVFNDVLEHMVDPWATLRATTAHLSTTGVVVASIPNVRHIKIVANLLLRGDWTYTDMGILDRTHLRFFTARTIRTMFSDSGFAVDRIEGISPIGHLRSPIWRCLSFLLGDMAYTGFAVTAFPLGVER